VIVVLHEIGTFEACGSTGMGAMRMSDVSKDVVGSTVSTCPTSASGREYASVRVSAALVAACVYVWYFAAKMVFACSIVVVNSIHSPAGETVVVAILFASANAWKAATALDDGCTYALSSSVRL
jgi:hypothetical protein